MSFAGSAIHRLLNLFLDCAEVEACAGLHRREVGPGLCQFGDLLLEIVSDEMPVRQSPYSFQKILLFPSP
jgi:hypothetical protein